MLCTGIQSLRVPGGHVVCPAQKCCAYSSFDPSPASAIIRTVLARPLIFALFRPSAGRQQRIGRKSHVLERRQAHSRHSLLSLYKTAGRRQRRAHHSSLSPLPAASCVCRGLKFLSGALDGGCGVALLRVCGGCGSASAIILLPWTLGHYHDFLARTRAAYAGLAHMSRLCRRA